MKRVVILGSTGSVGVQTLDVIRTRRDLFDVVGIAAGSNRELLAEQAREFQVEHQAVGIDETEAMAGGLDCDVVVNGITGSIGLRPTLAALGAGRTLALANKESIIAGGELVMDAAAPGQLVSVDSEHSAIAQAMRAGRRDEIARILITASGGPFRGRIRAELHDATPEQALQHPTWNMGKMITTNSATLVNKGLEVLEARVLFDIDLDHIDVVVHPQSRIHSMVEFIDGATIAHASVPDMRLPLAAGLSWPDRLPDVVPPLDWTVPSAWTFEPVDHDTFPAIRLAKQAGKAGGVFPAIYNAANEEAVNAFHDHRLKFTSILDIVDAALNNSPFSQARVTLDEIDEAERWARNEAQHLVKAGT